MALHAIDVGTRRVVQAPLSLGICEAACLMHRHEAGCLVVTGTPGDGEPIGIVTDRDLAMRLLAAGRAPGDACLGDVMSTPLLACRHDATLDEVVATMRGHGVRRLPLLDEAGHLVGIVSANDVLVALNALTAQLTEVLILEPLLDRTYA